MKRRKVLKFLRSPECRVSLAVLSVLLLAGMYAVKTSGAFSPGPLSGAHPKDEPLNGYVSHADIKKECGYCHAPLHCLTDSKCQDCHMDIAHQRASASGLHSKLPGVKRCQNCHVEHMGAEADITELAMTNFDHDKLSGFSLAKHGQDYSGETLDCGGCHQQGSFTAEALDCLGCHSQENHDSMAAHITDYNSDCISCHDGSDRMANFAHADTYQLEGAHAEAECGGCHGEKVFGGTDRECAGCHADPELHAGLFGENCGFCHTATAWSPVQPQQHDFVLAAGGTSSECEFCHAGSYIEYPCFSCHDGGEMGSVHQQLGINGGHENCVACHPNGPGRIVKIAEPVFGSGANEDMPDPARGPGESNQSGEQQKGNESQEKKPEDAGAAGSPSVPVVPNSNQHPGWRITPTPPYASGTLGAVHTNRWW